MEFPYIFTWGNNPKRATMKGRKCRITARGGRNSIRIEFEDGQREIVSGTSIQRTDQLPRARNCKLQKALDI